MTLLVRRFPKPKQPAGLFDAYRVAVKREEQVDLLFAEFSLAHEFESNAVKVRDVAITASLPAQASARGFSRFQEALEDGGVADGMG